ncbi:MAG: hypothetical protein IPN76_31840 [Saprospiraceae bacterium]|nr:hypothetical protein [Saprospiraceae bacterium]
MKNHSLSTQGSRHVARQARLEPLAVKIGDLNGNAVLGGEGEVEERNIGWGTAPCVPNGNSRQGEVRIIALWRGLDLAPCKGTTTSDAAKASLITLLRQAGDCECKGFGEPRNVLLPLAWQLDAAGKMLEADATMFCTGS